MCKHLVLVIWKCIQCFFKYHIIDYDILELIREYQTNGWKLTERMILNDYGFVFD